MSPHGIAPDDPDKPRLQIHIYPAKGRSLPQPSSGVRQEEDQAVVVREGYTCSLEEGLELPAREHVLRRYLL